MPWLDAGNYVRPLQVTEETGVVEALGHGDGEAALQVAGDGEGHAQGKIDDSRDVQSMGGIGDRTTVPLIEIVAVQDPRGPVRKRIRLSDDVVTGATERVIDPRPPSAPKPPLGFERHRIVSPSPLAHLGGQGRQELRVRAEKLGSGGRWALAQRSEPRVSVEGVLDRRQELRADLEVARIDLIEVDREGGLSATEPEQLRTASEIARRQDERSRELPLHLDGILLDVGRLSKLIGELDVRARSGQEAQARPRRLLDPLRERVGQRSRGRQPPVRGRAVRREGAVPARARGGRRGLVGDPEQAESPAQDRSFVERPGESGSRSPFESGWVAFLRRVAVGPRVHEAPAERHAGDGLDRPGSFAVETHDRLVVFLMKSGLVLEAKAEVEDDAVAHPPIVLDESSEVVDEILERRVPRQRASRGKAEKEARQRIARTPSRVGGIWAGGEAPVELEAPRGGAGQETVASDPAIPGAELQGVIADELRGGAVHLMGEMEDVVRVRRAVGGKPFSVVRDPDHGEDLSRDLGKVVRREAEQSWIVGGVARLVREREIPVAEGEHGVVADDPRVVHGEEVDLAEDLSVVWIGGPTIKERKGLVGVVIHVGRAQGVALVELVLEVERELIGGVHHGSARAHLAGAAGGEKSRQIQTDRIEAVGGDDVSWKRIAKKLSGVVRVGPRGERIVKDLGSTARSLRALHPPWEARAEYSGRRSCGTPRSKPRRRSGSG